MASSAFFEARFWLLILFSGAIPFGIYAALLHKRALSRRSVLFFGFGLVFIAGIDVYLLQRLATIAKLSPSLIDDAVFSSEVSVALYLLPALFGGIGINMVSHVLTRHLDDAERQFRREHKDHTGPAWRKE
jgi:uncharacterized membrane protein